MKKKLMMVAVLLGALSLGACVDDNESASVTNIRNAKADQLTALAEQARAEGEAAKILAEAEKAIADAKAAYLNEMTEEARQKFVETLKQIQAETEAAVKKAQMQAQQYEQQLLREASQRVKDAYDTYSTAAKDLQELKFTKSEATLYLAQLEAGMGNLQAHIDARTIELKNDIALKTAEKEAWENYSGADKSELEAQRAQLDQEYTNAESNIIQKNAEVQAALVAAVEVVDAFNYEYANENSPAAVKAIRSFIEKATENGKVIINNVASYEDKEITPILSEDVVLSEEISPSSDAYSVIRYYVSEANKTIMNQYYSNKENLEDELGHKASGQEVATGKYKELAEAEEKAAESKKKYEDSAKEYAELEETVAGAKQAIANAEKALEDAKAAKKEKDAAVEAAEEALTKLPDTATPVEIAQAELNLEVAKADANLAQANVEKAQKDLEKLKIDNEQAIDDFEELEKELPTLQATAEEDAISVATLLDEIAKLEEQIINFDTNAKLWNEALTAIESEEYAKAVEAVKSNTAITAYIAAEVAYNEAYYAWWEVNAEYQVLSIMINGAYDAEEEIAKVEKEIAELQFQLDRLAYENFDLDGNGVVTDSKANREKLIEQQTDYVEYLEEQISYKEQIVALFKADLEAAINAQDDSADTPAEDQPAA